MLTAMSDVPFKNIIFLDFVKKTSGEIDDQKDLYY